MGLAQYDRLLNPLSKVHRSRTKIGSVRKNLRPIWDPFTAIYNVDVWTLERDSRPHAQQRLHDSVLETLLWKMSNCVSWVILNW